MKKLLLILLLSPTLCFAGEHTENHNGTLYWVNDDGTWYYKGPAPHNWKQPAQPAQSAVGTSYTVSDQLDDIQIDIELIQMEIEQLSEH
jgi:hypothetical protein